MRKLFSITRKLFSLVVVLLLLMYILISRLFMLAEISSEARVASRPVYSDSMNFSETDKLTWTVPIDLLLRDEGQGGIFLVCDDTVRSSSSGARNIFRASSIRVRASARMDDGIEVNRLVQNSYYISDHPFDHPFPEDAGIWPYRIAVPMEYMLGAAWYYPDEVFVLEIEAESPHALLRDLDFKLKFTANHDFVMHHGILYVSLAMNALAGWAFLLTLTLGYLAWKPARAVPSTASASLSLEDRLEKE